MRYAFLILLPIFLYVFDSMLPDFYIFDPAKLQELSQGAIAKHGGPRGNATLLLEDLVESLRLEYGDKYVNSLNKDDWFFKYVFRALYRSLRPDLVIAMLAVQWAQ